MSSSKNPRVPKVIKFQEPLKFQKLSSSKTLEFQKLSSSRNSQVPETLEFQKLSSSKSHRVSKTLKFQKLSTSKSHRVSRNSRVPETLEFQKSSSSKNSQVPKTLEFQKLSSSKSHRVPKAIEFHSSEPEFQNTSEFQRTEFHHSELQFHTYFCVTSTRVPFFRTRVPKYFSDLHTLFGFHNNSSSTELYRVPSSHN